jgi:hypothetical protein
VDVAHRDGRSYRGSIIHERDCIAAVRNLKVPAGGDDMADKNMPNRSSNMERADGDLAVH